MASIECVVCAERYDVADDDPLWSETTEDGTVTGRHIEAPCPSCGSVSTHGREPHDLLNRIDEVVG